MYLVKILTEEEQFKHDLKAKNLSVSTHCQFGFWKPYFMPPPEKYEIIGFIPTPKAKSKVIVIPTEFCKVCHGITKDRCLFCGCTITDYRKLNESQVNHNLYLRGTWDKLKRLKMLTTGIFTLDKQLVDMWGWWKPLTMAESFARDFVIMGIPVPTYLKGHDVEEKIDEIVKLLIASTKENTRKENADYHR